MQIRRCTLCTVAKHLLAFCGAGGEVVEVSASVVKLGRDVATIEVQLRQQRTGQLVATVSREKGTPRTGGGGVGQKQ